MHERQNGEYVSTTTIDWVVISVAVVLMSCLIVSLVSDAALQVTLHSPLVMPIAGDFPDQSARIALIDAPNILMDGAITD
ncbi:MAG: hypothetical protein AAF501_07515 [Pseudomonadota bacterium]